MTLIWTADHKRTTVPPVGYLSASSRRSDSDCINQPHLAEVLRARRDRENYAHRSGEPVQGGHPRVAGDAAPGLPAASIIERMDEWWLSLSHREARFVTVCILVAVFCAAAVVIL